MTRKTAKELYQSGFWKTMTYEDRAKFQLFERRLCMPFNIFYAALEKALGRDVGLHELCLNIGGLKKEILGEAPAPSLADIFDLIPEEKRIIIMAD